MTETLSQTIQKLVEDSKQDCEPILHLVDGLIVSWREAELKIRKMLATLLLFWTLTFLIAEGLVSDAALTGFKVNEIQSLLIAAPIIMGANGYLLFSAVGIAKYIQNVVLKFYEYLAPELHGEKLHQLLGPPTFLNIEITLGNRAKDEILKRIHFRWAQILIFSILMLPLFSLIHCGYLMWLNTYHHMFAKIASIAVGFLFLAAGAVSFLVAFSARMDDKQASTEAPSEEQTPSAGAKTSNSTAIPAAEIEVSSKNDEANPKD